MKTCKRCGHKFDTLKCKPCQKIYNSNYRIKNYEKIKEKDDKYRLYNREKTNAAVAKWAKENPERKKEVVAKWRLSNQEKERSSSSIRNAKWRKEHPEAYRIYTSNYRNRKRINGGKLSNGLTEKLYKLQKGKCACCKKPLGDNYHLDHIMPLALGGKHEDSNMQLLTQTCNQQKHAKHPISFMQQRGFLL